MARNAFLSGIGDGMQELMPVTDAGAAPMTLVDLQQRLALPATSNSGEQESEGSPRKRATSKQ